MIKKIKSKKIFEDSRAHTKEDIHHLIKENLPLAGYSSFKVGGKADFAAWPQNGEEVQAVLQWAKERGIPVTVLGSASNVLISDAGVEGLVLFTTNLQNIGVSEHEPSLVLAGSGSLMTCVSEFAAQNSLQGLEFIYSMPGTTGGAVWMNARCYGAEISEVLESVSYIHVDTQKRARYAVQRQDFAYKTSPFQKQNAIIIDCRFRLKEGDSKELWRTMQRNEDDRRRKGHFLAPCAGSIFKNNREFGAPSGEIIDSLGLRGLIRGGAKVSDLHANIIINAENARAEDIALLMAEIHERVLGETGHDLEAEVVKIGRW